MHDEPESTASVRISDDSVRRATGRTWGEWFTILDAAGASSMSHGEIVGLVGRRKAVGRWWTQMVAVAYQQARNGRGRADERIAR